MVWKRGPPIIIEADWFKVVGFFFPLKNVLGFICFLFFFFYSRKKR